LQVFKHAHARRLNDPQIAQTRGLIRLDMVDRDAAAHGHGFVLVVCFFDLNADLNKEGRS